MSHISAEDLRTQSPHGLGVPFPAKGSSRPTSRRENGGGTGVSPGDLRSHSEGRAKIRAIIMGQEKGSFYRTS